MNEVVGGIDLMHLAVSVGLGTEDTTIGFMVDGRQRKRNVLMCITTSNSIIVRLPNLEQLNVYPKCCRTPNLIF